MFLGSFLLGFLPITVVVGMGSFLGVMGGSALEEINIGGFSQVEVLTLNNLERRVQEHMKDYLEKLKEQQTLVELYLKAYELRKPEGRRRSSPIFTFLTMKRLTVDIDNILKNMKKLNTFSAYLEEESRSSEWPRETDLDKVKAQILNIYNTYDITAAELADGYFQNSDLGVMLNGHHCFDIASYAVSQKQYASACEWMNMALTRNSIGFALVQSPTMTIYKAAATSAINTHNKLLKDYSAVSASLSTEQIWNTDLFVDNFANLESFSQSKIRHWHPKTNGTKLLRGVSQEIKFHQLCSQKFTRGPARDVYCWYERRLYPYLILNPFKVELLKRKPFTIQIHDFVPMSVRNAYMEHGIPKLVRLQVSSASASYSKAHPSQFHAEFNDYEKNRFDAFFKKVERIVGNYDQVNSMHEFYVSMYALGGFMEPPIDSLLQSRRRQSSSPASNSGQRATLVAYLNYVQAGAFTVFPKIGVAAFPTFASVVLMFEDANATAQNSRPCPIVSGQNYLLVQGISGVTNPFTFSSSLQHDRRFS